MDDRTRADKAHEALDRAARARQGSDGGACLRALADAWDLVAPTALHPLRARIAWRRAKAAYDFDAVDTMLDAVAPLLDEGRPFDDHPPARRAMQAIATRWWDRRGYADDRVARLWRAWAETYAAEGDPWMAAQGHAQLAWHHACAGEHDALDALVEAILQQDPRRFGQGPHRHPDAPDTPSSVWWAQLDRVRTGLWAATWSDRRDRARDLVDALEDAAEGARLQRHDDPWFLDPILRAGLAFGLGDVVEAYADAWLPALDGVDGPRGRFHRALAEGLLAAHEGHLDAADDALSRAVAIADEAHLGPEWAVDARLRLADVRGAAGAAVRTAAADQARVAGIGAFPSLVEATGSVRRR